MNANLSRLQEFFAARGYSSPDIGLLQPAEPFLDTAGEDLRRRIFMTNDLGGASLCLRPEFTIPVCLAHLASGGFAGKYAYGGSVFRQRRDGPAEFLQAGMETIGNQPSAGVAGATNNDVANDVECITTAVRALNHCGMDRIEVVFGDQAIFEALLLALQLPQAWRARLGRAFGDSERIENDLQLIANTSDGLNALDGLEAGLRQALDKNDHHRVERWIKDKMAVANLPASGGRTARHIAERMAGKAELAATRLSDEQRRVLSAFLRIEVPIGEAVTKLREFSSSLEIDIDEAIETFAGRAEILAHSTNENATFIWRASFGRRLDYYTGMVFEIFQPGATHPVCGGGRYDHLMNMLGAEGEIPAIGFSIWLDRLPGELK
jgi:ATP phosphoribosyltransferase regulatory subunit